VPEHNLKKCNKEGKEGKFLIINYLYANKYITFF